MSDYRRYYIAGGTYFFTVVAHDRRPFLATELARQELRTAIETVKCKWPFEMFAVALLPDHLHAIWALPRGDDRYSLRWQKIKETFTRGFCAAGGVEGETCESRMLRQERAIWQRRFWEHSIRDEDDLKRCVDYLHWNPVKHHLVRRVQDYPWSSFHRFVTMGEYELTWGGENPCPGLQMPE